MKAGTDQKVLAAIVFDKTVAVVNTVVLDHKASL
jgi:hypothetical protein